LARARAKLGLDLIELDASGVQHDEEVIEHVGGFSDQPLTVLANRGNRGLDRFFTELLGALRHAAVQKLAGIGHVRALLRAHFDPFFQVMEGEAAHGLSLASLQAAWEGAISDPLAVFTGAFPSGQPLFRIARMNSPALDFWFDFASTYSYPAALRISELADEAGISINFRPFLLGPIFKAQGWTTSPFNLYPAKGGYMWRDLERICADLALPFVRPDPFPQNSLLAARVALAGLRELWGEEFCLEVFRSQFGEGQRIDTADVISKILARLGVAPGPVLEKAQSDGGKAALRDQTAEAERRGIFGAPTFITADGEMFWGNDRLERALRWAKQA
jgi:2-hydroxychromene-2-carboxylate isomerase